MKVAQEKTKNHTGSPTIATAKRAMNLSKTYIALGILISIIAIVAWNFGFYISQSTNSTNSTSSNSIATAGNAGAGIFAKVGLSAALISVPFSIIPMLMIVTPVIILFVYDKNGGMFEYLLSLGIRQRQIYMRYIKAALLMVTIFFIPYSIADFVYLITVLGKQVAPLALTILALSFPIGLAVVSFMLILMMTFSVLQKTRAGSNQPLAITIGFVAILPGFVIPFVAPFNIAVFIEIIEAILFAMIVVSLILSSDKIIRREKLLP